MKSEKVKEIKKALEDNITDHFPYIDGHKCKLLPYATILTLINELESENERLLEQRNKTYNIWAKDTEKLKDRIAELENENKDYYDRLNNLQTYINNHEEVWKHNTEIKLKQFAERVKMEFSYEFDELIPSIMADKIDKILKEFLGK